MNGLLTQLRKKVIQTCLKPIYERLATLEGLALNPRRRILHEVAGYLVSAEVPGDYLEFGVFQGATFSYAFQRLAPEFAGMRFVAFDSFQGLPRPQGLDAQDGYSSSFHENQYACTESEFVSNLKKAGVNLQRVSVVKGWFADTLTPENAMAHGVDKVAVAWIDGDLYESTVPVLNYLTPRLTTGSVILFDDWRCFRNHPDFGEQRACREWLNDNPQITLREFLPFGWHGQAFTVVVR
jgi:hypothetical protein